MPGPFIGNETLLPEYSWVIKRQGWLVWVNPLEKVILRRPFLDDGSPEGRASAVDLDDWDLSEIRIPGMVPFEDRSALPDPGYVWATDARPWYLQKPDRESTDRVATAVKEGGWSGIAVLTDQHRIRSELGGHLRGLSVMHFRKPDEVTRKVLDDNVLLVIGHADFLDATFRSLPSYSRDYLVGGRVLFEVGPAMAIALLDDALGGASET